LFIPYIYCHLDRNRLAKSETGEVKRSAFQPRAPYRSSCTSTTGAIGLMG
jgi:hypothetical protein